MPVAKNDEVPVAVEKAANNQMMPVSEEKVANNQMMPVAVNEVVPVAEEKVAINEMMPVADNKEKDAKEKDASNQKPSPAKEVQASIKEWTSPQKKRVQFPENPCASQFFDQSNVCPSHSPKKRMKKSPGKPFKQTVLPWMKPKQTEAKE